MLVFGCLCYSSTPTAHWKKLDSRVVPAIFLGFKPHSKRYIYLNLKNHKIDFSRHLIFHENCFPYHSSFENNKDSNSLSLPVSQHYTQTYDDLHMHKENLEYTNDNLASDMLPIDKDIIVDTTPRRSI